MTADEMTWNTPQSTAPLLGLTTREVQQLCAADQIDHRRVESPGGRVRYLISVDAAKRYLNRTTRRTNVRRSA